MIGQRYRWWQQVTTRNSLKLVSSCRWNAQRHEIALSDFMGVIMMHMQTQLCLP